jgi:hypothetical protein
MHHGSRDYGADGAASPSGGRRADAETADRSSSTLDFPGQNASTLLRLLLARHWGRQRRRHWRWRTAARQRWGQRGGWASRAGRLNGAAGVAKVFLGGRERRALSARRQRLVARKRKTELTFGRPGSPGSPGRPGRPGCSVTPPGRMVKQEVRGSVAQGKAHYASALTSPPGGGGGGRLPPPTGGGSPGSPGKPGRPGMAAGAPSGRGAAGAAAAGADGGAEPLEDDRPPSAATNSPLLFPTFNISSASSFVSCSPRIAMACRRAGLGHVRGRRPGITNTAAPAHLRQPFRRQGAGLRLIDQIECISESVEPRGHLLIENARERVKVDLPVCSKV